VLQYMNPFSYLGLSATVNRVDRRHLLLFDVVGPVVTKGRANQMPPTVYFVHTGEEAPGWVYKSNYPPHYQWNVVLSQLAKSEERLSIVKKFVYQDIDDNRTLACVAERRVFAKALYRQLVQDGYRAVYVDGETKAKLRDKIYNEFREGKYQVICAGKVLNALIDLPNLDCIHLLTPSNSKATSQQIYGRSRRPLPGKRNPIIRYYVDKGGQLDGSYKNQQRLCKENGWATQVVGLDAARMLGLSLWKRRSK
jgi:superfamily II DNA or RNA helicase